MPTVVCHRVDMDAVDECSSLSGDTVDTHPWTGQEGVSGTGEGRRPRGTTPLLVTALDITAGYGQGPYEWSVAHCLPIPKAVFTSAAGGGAEITNASLYMQRPPPHRVPATATPSTSVAVVWQCGGHLPSAVAAEDHCHAPVHLFY